MPIDTIRTINRLMTSAQQWRDGDVTPATRVGADWKRWQARTDDSTLKPPIPLSTTALPGAANLFLSSPFEHVFKGLAIEVRRRSVPRTSDGPALVYSG
jgi:hypothetical protein